MKYISIDIETTGLDPKKDQVLQFSAIIEDTNNTLPYEELPKLDIIVRHKYYHGSVFALNMNSDLLEILAKNEDPRIFDEKDVISEFIQWLLNNGYTLNEKNKIEVVAAGKNFGTFDKQFIQALPDSSIISFGHRFIDPTICFVDWKNDTRLPNLDTCKSRAGINGNVSHNALEDAWDVIRIMRTVYV